jgi:hypothetical protein
MIFPVLTTNPVSPEGLLHYWRPTDGWPSQRDLKSRVPLDETEGVVKGIVLLGALSTTVSPERLKTKTLEISP